MNINSLPFRYRLFGDLNRFLGRLKNIIFLGYHPFVLIRNKFNKFFFKYLSIDIINVINIKNGFKIKVRLNDQAVASLIFDRIYSPSETNLIIKYASSKTTFIDIGASYGYFTILSALSGYKKVLSFEPNKLLYPLIKESCNINSIQNIVEVFPYAISNVRSTGKLTYPFHETSSGSVTEKSPGMQVIEVPLHPLDDFIEKISDDVFLKIDAEGHELEVVEGAIHIIQNKKPVILWEVGHIDSSQILNFLNSFNYSHFILTETDILPLNELQSFFSRQKVAMILSKPAFN